VLGRSFNWLIPDALITGRLELRLPLVVGFAESIPEAKGTEDFIGLNYYSRDMIRFAPLNPMRFERVDLPNVWRSDIGWEIYAHGIYRLLKDIQKRYPRLPVLITENGLADAEDKHRGRFIQEHLRSVHQAISEGVKVEAYSHWSLLDNFEWAEGFEPRFGLCAVDYSTMRRTIRGSAKLYAKIARANALEMED
jgi:beta-glucosidase